MLLIIWMEMSGSLQIMALKGITELRFADLYVRMLLCRKSCTFWSIHTSITYFYLCMCSTA